MLARCLMMMMLTFLPFASHVEAGFIERMRAGRQVSAPATIKVLVVDDADGATLEVKGRYKLFNPENGKHVDTRMAGKRKYIQAMTDGLRWGEEFPGLHQLCVVPDSSETTIVVDGIEYSGAVYVYDVEGLISVVNEVSIEDYVGSILAPHYKQALPEEVMAAVVISARTTALYQARHPKTHFWAVEAGAVGYQGMVVVKPTSPVVKAIAATKNMVMSQTNELFMAGWEASSAEAGIKNSSISLNQAEALAQKGENAAQILTHAFPGTSIQLVK